MLKKCSRTCELIGKAYVIVVDGVEGLRKIPLQTKGEDISR
jgi:hypothetical protein